MGDSRELLRRLARDVTVPKDRVFFYLDAHWGDDLPLREELAIIGKAWSKPVLLIDDFEVPGDPGYGFDDYGPGKTLTMSYLACDELQGYACLVPALRSDDETGACRGCVVLVAKEHAAVACEAGGFRQVFG